jgi:hypothetical protein
MAEAAMIPSERGVIYLALGASYIAEARISAESVRRFMPELTLVLFTDCPPADRGIFDEVMPLERVHAKAHINKLISMLHSPFEQTLFLDTDTFVCGPFAELFDLLDHFDIAMSHDRRYFDWFPEGVGVTAAFREFNQGVVVFRRSAGLVRALEHSISWVERLTAMMGRCPDDQPPLRLALYGSDLRIATLTYEYNCRFHTFGQVNGKVVILHGRIPGQPFKKKNLLKIAECINKKTIPRVFVAGKIYTLERQSVWGKSYFCSRKIATMFRPSLAFWRANLTHAMELLQRQGLWQSSIRLWTKNPGFPWLR